jgi:ATP-dependent DNA helicase RecG
VSSVPISYHGIYHYRTGSTKQELKGVGLQNWLLKKIGRHWEDLSVPNSSIEDLDQDSIRSFVQKAIVQKRIYNCWASSQNSKRLKSNVNQVIAIFNVAFAGL